MEVTYVDQTSSNCGATADVQKRFLSPRYYEYDGLECYAVTALQRYRTALTPFCIPRSSTNSYMEGYPRQRQSKEGIGKLSFQPLDFSNFFEEYPQTGR